MVINLDYDYAHLNLNSMFVCLMLVVCLIKFCRSYHLCTHLNLISIVFVRHGYLILYNYDHEILPVNFTIYRKDRPSRGGGILVAVSNVFDSVHLSSPADLEIVTIQLGCCRDLRNFTGSNGIPQTIYLGNVCATTDFDKTSLFNKYFHSVYSSVHCDLPSLFDFPQTSQMLGDISIQESEVYELLISLNTSKAMGCGGISPMLLKHCAIALFQPLRHLFLLSIMQLFAVGMENSFD